VAIKPFHAGNYIMQTGIYTVSQKTVKIIFVISLSNFHQLW